MEIKSFDFWKGGKGEMVSRGHLYDQEYIVGTSLGVQWLRLCTPNVGGLG